MSVCVFVQAALQHVIPPLQAPPWATHMPASQQALTPVHAALFRQRHLPAEHSSPAPQQSPLQNVPVFPAGQQPWLSVLQVWGLGQHATAAPGGHLLWGGQHWPA